MNQDVGKKKDGLKPSFFRAFNSELAAVVHAEFDWMRCHAHFCDLFHLEINLAIDPVIRKYTAAR